MRIVSLCPSITETLIELGLASSLVGITRFCIHPKDITRSIPKIGGTKDPDLDAIRRAKPDLIFVNAEENRREDFEILRAEFGVDVSMPTEIAQVPEAIRQFGALTGTQPIAIRIARAIEEAHTDLLADVKAEALFRFVYLVWREPWMTLNRDTYVSDLLTCAGGINLFGDEPERYPTISLEALSERAPDLVLLPDEPFPFAEKHTPEVTLAVPRARIELVSGDDCCWHGVRSLRGLRLMKDLRARLLANAG